MIGKEEITKLLRPLAVKWITRGVLWVMAAKLGLPALEAEPDAAIIGKAGAAIVCIVVSLLIDRWHHRQDLAEQPK